MEEDVKTENKPGPIEGQVQAPTTWPLLTNREIEVADLLARGASIEEVAQTLGVTRATVETHKLHLLQKLDLRGSVALARYAIRNGLVSADAAQDLGGPRAPRGRGRR